MGIFDTHKKKEEPVQNMQEDLFKTIQYHDEELKKTLSNAAAKKNINVWAKLV